MRTVGIIGFGKLGTVIARLAVAGGWRALIVPSPRQKAVALVLSIMAPGAEVATVGEVVRDADIVVVTVPYGKAASFDWSALDGKIVVDPMNYWAAVDGDPVPGADAFGSSSEHTASRNPRMRLVKAFNHLGYHDLEEESQHGWAPPGGKPVRALGLASDDEDAKAIVAELVTASGFEPVDVGSLAAGARLETGTPVFGRAMSAAELRELIGTPDSARDPTTGI